MPTRLARWIRSKLSAITARTPRSRVPLAAQSRDDPVPYSLPATTTRGLPSALYRSAASKMAIRSPEGTWTVTPPSTPGTIWFLRRMLAKVPRTITRSLPRREP